MSRISQNHRDHIISYDKINKILRWDCRIHERADGAKESLLDEMEEIILRITEDKDYSDNFQAARFVIGKSRGYVMDYRYPQGSVTIIIRRKA